MSLSGNIQDVSVADTLQFIHLGGRTGTLTLSCGDAKAAIGFHQGRIVNAWAPGTKRLGDLLIEGGVIDNSQLDEALLKQETEHPRRSLGQVLVAMGAVDADTVYRTVEQQIERTVYELVSWNQGTFQVKLDDLQPIDDLALVPGDVIRHLNLDTAIVLRDMRGGPLAIATVSALRRARPRASILVLADSNLRSQEVYEAGAIAVLSGELPLMAACLRSVARNRRDLMTGASRADRINANFAKLRRIVGDLRSGLISTTISLSLMNILSESVERAVLFLVRKDGLVALGAFGNSPGGQPLAKLTRGLSLELASRNAINDSLADGRVRNIPVEEAHLPDSFAGLLGRPRSGECAIFPVMGGQRVIALVYADNGHSNRAIEELDILELAAAQAGLAFENELLRRQTTQHH